MAYDQTRNRYRSCAALCPECFQMNLNINEFMTGQGRGGFTSMKWTCEHCKKEMEVYMELESIASVMAKTRGLEG